MLNQRNKTMWVIVGWVIGLGAAGVAITGAATGDVRGCGGTDPVGTSEANLSPPTTPTPTYNCSYGEGTAGPGTSSGGFDVCPGEDFWLPEGTSDSPTANVGVWHTPVNADGSAAYDSDLAPTVRLNWDLSSSTAYDETHSTFAATSLRRSLYRHSEEFCIYLCENVIPWTGGACAVNTSSDYYETGSVWDMPWYAYNGVCNPAFKATADYRARQRRILISLGEGGLINGALPASCGLDSFSDAIESYVDANNPSAPTPAEVKTNIQTVLDHAAGDPDWFDTAAITACAQEHIGNVLRSIDAFGMMDQIYAFNFTHEGGYQWDWFKLGFNASPDWAQRDALLANWIKAVGSAVDAYESNLARRAVIKGKFFVNFYHGRAFKAQVAEALKQGMGLGEHSQNTAFAFSYVQHLPHVTYNQSAKRYDANLGNVPSVLHTDIEGMHKAHSDLVSRRDLNTLGQYRIYRMAALSEVALGYNSFTNTGALIPSQGNYQSSFNSGEGCEVATAGLIVPTGYGDNRRLCNFDYSQIDGALIDGSGGMELYSWLRKSAGRQLTKAPEAYCAFHRTGAAIPSGKVFSNEIARNKSNEHWGQLTPSPKFSKSYLEYGGEYFHHEVRTDWQYAPLVTNWGRFCELTSYSRSGFSTNLEGGREMTPDLIGKTDPDLRNKTFTGDMEGDGNYAYEAMRLDNAVDTAVIALDLNDAFVNARSGKWVVKITLSATPDFCTSTGGSPSSTAIGSFGVSYASRLWGATKRLKLQIDGAKTSLCTLSGGTYRPNLITVSLPLDKRVNLQSPVGSGTNANLLIIEDPSSSVPWDVLLVRVIDTSFTD